MRSGLVNQHCVAKRKKAAVFFNCGLVGLADGGGKEVGERERGVWGGGKSGD